jgi:transposase
LRHKSCKKEEEVFIRALTGNFQKTHLFALKQSLETYDYFAKQIDELDEVIKQELEGWQTVVEGPIPTKKKSKMHPKYVNKRKPDRNEFNFDIQTLLYQKTGVDLTAINALGGLSVATIISELGGREGIEKFKTEKEWCSWLTLCPGNNISGGKSFGGQSRKSRNRIKRTLCVAAMSLCHAKCSLGAYYRRMAARVGKAKALKAVAHKLARLIYQLLKNGQEYVEVGQDMYQKHYERKRLKILMKNAREMGYELKPAAA